MEIERVVREASVEVAALDLRLVEMARMGRDWSGDGGADCAAVLDGAA